MIKGTMQMPAPGEVHIWTAVEGSHGILAPELEKTLSPDERSSAGSFLLTRHRTAYIFAHAVLRDVLSLYVERAPEEILFIRDSFGKPFLGGDGAKIPLLFNLSHSGSMVLVAVAAGRQIGADLEQIRPLHFACIAEANFTPEERSFISGHAPERQERAFFQCWTRKEAYIKAVGKGLSIPLNTFDTCIAAGQPGRQLPRTAEAPDVTSWFLADLDLPAGYTGAVAVGDGFHRLMYYSWKPADIPSFSGRGA
jgi:4'-phosphopantetheinyl transferase